MLKKVSLGLFIVLIAAQFWRPARNESTAASPNDIKVKHPVPADVQALLRRACYDCHSNNTRYPWYAEVQPVRWWLDRHIHKGRAELNFSAFSSYATKRAVRKLEEIADEVTDHRMPLPSYTWMHPEARLTPDEIRLLATWAEGLHDEIAP